MEYHSGGSLPLLGRPRYCPGANANGGYLCETGHCCGETGCCTYYYELWWFWLLWTVLILFSCCCAYRHRRAKLRVQQQQRQREISLLAYHGASSYPSSMLDLSFLASLKLPSYEEVAAQPSTPPPPYSSVFTTPRYPQPPRASDPHLLTQHDPLLHRPLSDGPSSLSSDNSSSCSCDSCCPSSPCSSSLSAPVTYETDTSHASTPSEATPLTLDVTMETIAAAATCLEAGFSPETASPAVAVDVCGTDAARQQEAVATETSVLNQTVTIAVVTGAASPQSLSSPGTDSTLPVGATSPTRQHLDLIPCIPSISSVSTRPDPNAPTLPSIKIISTDGPDEGPKTNPGPKATSGSSTPTSNTSDSFSATKTPEPLNRTSDPTTPTPVPAPGKGRTLTSIPDSSGLEACDLKSSLVPIPASSNLNQTPVKGMTHGSDAVATNMSQVLEPVSTTLPQTSEAETAVIPHVIVEVPNNMSQGLEPEPAITNLTLVPQPYHSTLDPILNQKPAHLDLTIATDAASSSANLAQSQESEPSLISAVVVVPPSPRSGLSENPGAPVTSGLDPAVVQANIGQVLYHLSELDHISPLSVDAKSYGFGSGSPSTPILSFPTPAPTSPPSSCPAINIESANLHSLPSARSPTFSPCAPCPPSIPSPPSLASGSLPAPALLLDPLTALHPSDKAGSSGHASSLSPSPRATQSPPKQTLFSPCVDVFEPGPPNWEEGEDEREDEVNEEDEDEDMGADESQYRHRRLTGDSGIEVCRCRVDEEEEEEEDEEEEEEGERKKDGRRGAGGEKDNTDLHDSVDCPARGQISTGEGLTLCNSTSSTTPSSEDSGKVVIVMETV